MLFSILVYERGNLEILLHFPILVMRGAISRYSCTFQFWFRGIQSSDIHALFNSGLRGGDLQIVMYISVLFYERDDLQIFIHSSILFNEGGNLQIITHLSILV